MSGGNSNGKRSAGCLYQIGNDSNWKEVIAGCFHTLAIKTDGSLWAWGKNDIGQLGLGDNTNREAPVRIGTESNWKEVIAGCFHSLALKTDGSLWAWGDNWNGQLGLGDTTNRSNPVEIPMP